MTSGPRIAVVGGGISGLAAAHRLRRLLGDGAAIDLYEPAEPGGTLRQATVGGVTVDVGAEAFLVRRPEIVDLATELGIAGRIVHPARRQPALLADGDLRALPRPTLMGIPASVDAVREVIAGADVERIRGEADRPLDWTPGEDRSIGALVRDRLGDKVVDRSVDPMLSGVYSAGADHTSVRAALPQLAARLDAGAPSLTAAVSGLLAAPTPGPVFGSLRDGGYRVLVDALLAAARPAHRTDRVTAIRPAARGWSVHADAVRDYDAVIAAVSPPVAAGLLDGELGRLHARIPVAQSVLVVLAIDPAAPLPDNSGVLVASGESLRAKAFTFTTNKWPHLAGGPQLVRCSFGRYPQSLVDVSEAELVEQAGDDLARVCGLVGLAAPTISDAAVQRWSSGIPLYAPGHADLIAAIDAAAPRGLGLAGAAYAGVGVPACVARADAVVRSLVAQLN
ncbi:FAD-dependent oxidoreductase [Jongsikchunia kroppenstedtii]|uniref:FAD-dependent oxidoreductase n=1 Tax=Jongsikchunia kroppenstedtii TaxID=1121721 RepID=UPI00035FD1BC|nr:FAD-dependent oxidoreductase [Jongsikchunia kroppenstedtii]